MSSDLIDQLRAIAEGNPGVSHWSDAGTAREAIAEIERLQAEQTEDRVLMALSANQVVDFAKRGEKAELGRDTACREIERLQAALRVARAALTAPTIGTWKMDDPNWYTQVDEAVAMIDTALSGKGES